MRILHVDPERRFSGGEVQVFLLMEGLRERGHEGVLACVPGGEPEARARARGFQVAPIPMRNDLDLPAIWRLRRSIRSVGAGVVHLHTGRANWLGGIAARLAQRPAVTTRRMDRAVKSNWRTRWMYGSLLERAVAISPAVLERLVAGGVPRDRTRLIWSSLDVSSLEPARPRAEVRAELDVGETTPVVLAAGSLVERKGLDVLIEAWTRLGTADAVLWIAGEGERRSDLEQRIADHGLTDRVRLLGERGDVVDLLGAVDLFAMPSRAEGLGVAALEAMVQGRAVVASAVGGLAEVVVDGETGRLVPAADAGALAGALDALLGDRALRDRMGEAGRRRVRERFTAERMVADYEGLYREVLEESAG